MPEAELVIRPGYSHCGYMAAEPKAYVEQADRSIYGGGVNDGTQLDIDFGDDRAHPLCVL